MILFSSIESKRAKSARAGLSDIVESAFTTTISEKIEAITEKKDAERKDSKPPKELHGTSENFIFGQKRKSVFAWICDFQPQGVLGITFLFASLSCYFFFITLEIIVINIQRFKW